MSVDDMVGEVLHKLDALHETRNTLAFFLSDNGYMWHEHGLTEKRWPYPAAARVPFYVRWPGHFPPGATRRKIVANIDIAPTIYHAAGIVPNHVVDGNDLRRSHRSHIFLEGFLGRTSWWNALWWPHREYISYPHTRPHHEFYRAGDRWQLTNVYHDGRRGDEPRALQPYFDRLIAQGAHCAGRSC
jgi:arylsulfatase A-like enzyme